jgi:hypothetical protein
MMETRMLDARFVVVMAVLAGALVTSCGTDLGTCNENMPGGANPGGMSMAAAGQQVVAQACAGGRCHSATATGKNRVGVPAGLNFDVPSVVHDWSQTMWDQIEDGNMPPKNQGRVLSVADKETLRNWLACGAPTAPTMGVTADWSSIYMSLIGTTGNCLGCHGGDGSVGGGFALGMDPCTAYKNVVNAAAKTTIGVPSCAASGMKLVVPSQPDMSLLLEKLVGMPPCGSPMPLGSMGLGASNPTVMALRTWIMNGAQAPSGCM